ncbi:glycosyltransferase family 2 protein [Litoreibacter janthinus]|uniref:Glycosyl transferase family 2 n=1 Tax=Litoreibacter janthinus TaxID=670154 RepID=A0A1I6GEZ6_9RHOB|nr:glycosyltransferase family 2 protein [Litoreibacter janthinus]SFR40710.1 Glycosyl transferase family 2 [Litoreibacter janthinus]
MAAPKWGVVGTMDEPPQLVAAYAAHHLWSGASSVHIYLDRDDPKTRALLAPLAGVHVTIADAAYWRSAFDIKVPKTHQRRQTLNATHAYRSTDVDYLVHLDADEFIHQVEPLEKELARLRKMRPGDYLNIPNLERVWLEGEPQDSMFSQTFRASTKRMEGDFSRLVLDGEGLTRFGLTGHSEGKACSPTGYDYILGIHRPHHDTDRPWTFPGVKRSRSSVILHFDGMTRLHWVYKRLRKALFRATQVGQPITEQMQAQIDAIDAGGGDMAAANALHDRIKVLGKLADPLRAEDLLMDVPFDATRGLNALLPHENFDLSAAGFDAWLMEQKSEFFEGVG